MTKNLNPNLFDIVKLWVAENYPNLVVQYWERDGQIRISTAHIVPMEDSCVKYSLISIVNNTIFYLPTWMNYQYTLGDPTFFDKLKAAIDTSLEVIEKENKRIEARARKESKWVAKK